VSLPPTARVVCLYTRNERGESLNAKPYFTEARLGGMANLASHGEALAH
jgi:hypothetical protein